MSFITYLSCIHKYCTTGSPANPSQTGSTTSSSSNNNNDNNNSGSNNDSNNNNDNNNNDNNNDGDVDDLSALVNRTHLVDFPFCGERRSPTRVVGGSVTRLHEYPGLCSLQFRSTM